MANLLKQVDVATTFGTCTYVLSSVESVRGIRLKERINIRSDNEDGDTYEAFLPKYKIWMDMDVVGEKDLFDHVVSSPDYAHHDYIYFIKLSQLQPNQEIKNMISTHDQNELIYNIPMNLIYAAACTDGYNLVYVEDASNRRIVRLVRYHNSVVCYPIDDMVGSFCIDFIGDHLVANLLCTRSIQYNNFKWLVTRCKQFLNKINNGNLLLAFSDIWHNHDDAESIDLERPTDDVANIIYNQNMPLGTGNRIAVKFANNDKEVVYYESDGLDEDFVNILIKAIDQSIETLIQNRNQ